jgi:hypothetical protein
MAKRSSSEKVTFKNAATLPGGTLLPAGTYDVQINEIGLEKGDGTTWYVESCVIDLPKSLVPPGNVAKEQRLTLEEFQRVQAADARPPPVKD